MRLSGLRSVVEAHWRSRVALGFAFLHAIVFLAIIFTETPLPPPSDEPCPPLPTGSGCFDIWDAGDGIIVASRFFHQDLDFNLLMTVDLPGLLVGTVVTLPLTLAGVSFSRLTESYIVAWMWFVLGTLQWWLCGLWLAARRAQRAA
jgi:hypothetical protein